MASASVIPSLGDHRQDVDESRYPWSAIGKLYNETGGSCSGVAIAANKILTAAHCVYNFRSQRFIPADALHFLLGYRSGHYAMHARVASYEIGPGFDPLRYDATSDADWAILTVTENMPADITPLRLSHGVEPSGTKAVIAGYPQDRAHAMTADSDCELREEIDGGRLMLHTCRGVGGYSGAPILVSAGGNEVQIAGIQIARFKSGGCRQDVGGHGAVDRAGGRSRDPGRLRRSRMSPSGCRGPLSGSRRLKSIGGVAATGPGIAGLGADLAEYAGLNVGHAGAALGRGGQGQTAAAAAHDGLPSGDHAGLGAAALSHQPGLVGGAGRFRRPLAVCLYRHLVGRRLWHGLHKLLILCHKRQYS